MLYLDTSLLVAAVSDENATRRVQGWLRMVDDTVAISDWSLAEFFSAIEGKARGGQMLIDQRDAAYGWFRKLCAEMVEMLPVDRFAFQRAASIVKVPGVRVRAADALHLAVAEGSGAVLCTLDKPQAEAGRSCNIKTEFFVSTP